jgi:hypothetical protein
MKAYPPHWVIKRGKLFITIFLLVIALSCEKLEVENFNDPTTSDILSSPDDVKALVQSSFLTYWQAIKTTNVGITAHVMADHSTSPFGNFEWRHNCKEPRKQWDPFATQAWVTDSVYFGLYRAITQVNDALSQILVNGMQIGEEGIDNPMVEASAYLIRGLSLGQLGLTFDKCLIYRQNSDLANVDFKPWNLVLEAAIDDLEKAIQICKTNTFYWPQGSVNGMTMDNNYIGQLANSYAARFLMLGARNKAQNDDLSWTDKYSWDDILSFANNGITTDFAPEGNGLPWNGGIWWDLNVKYLRQNGWTGVDCRVINLLDPLYPVRYPSNSEGYLVGYVTIHDDLRPGEAISDDNRFYTDFQYFLRLSITVTWGYLNSHYRHSRYDFPATTNTEGNFMGESLGPLKELTVYDNQLMLAEAYARTNRILEAAAILNAPSNPRKVRGNLPDVMANKEEILKAIFYERYIELMHNGYLISFCDMRRTDELQYGTPLHFPIPAKELITLNLDVYTFGGIENADGINTSKGGEWIKPFYHFTPSW